jgi:hypothetical protein
VIRFNVNERQEKIEPPAAAGSNHQIDFTSKIRADSDFLVEKSGPAAANSSSHKRIAVNFIAPALSSTQQPPPPPSPMAPLSHFANNNNATSFRNGCFFLAFFLF